MAKRIKRTKKGGRVTPKGTRPVGQRSSSAGDCCSSCEPAPPGRAT